MGILDRFTTIVKANINELLDKAEDPAKMVDQYLVDLTESLAEVKQETAAVMAEEKRTKRAADENAEEVARMEDLAKKALQAGNEDDARVFLAKKQKLATTGVELLSSQVCNHSIRLLLQHAVYSLDHSPAKLLGRFASLAESKRSHVARRLLSATVGHHQQRRPTHTIFFNQSSILLTADVDHPKHHRPRAQPIGQSRLDRRAGLLFNSQTRSASLLAVEVKQLDTIGRPGKRLCHGRIRSVSTLGQRCGLTAHALRSTRCTVLRTGRSTARYVHNSQHRQSHHPSCFHLFSI